MPSNTLIFSVPAMPPGRFVSSIHDSKLHPISLSSVTGWWKPPKDFHQPLLWTNLVVLPGDDITFPEGEDFGMTDWWRITVSHTADTIPSLTCSSKTLSQAGSQPEDREVAEPPGRQLGEGKCIFKRPEHWQESLLQFAKSKSIFEGPVVTICLLALRDEAAYEKYTSFVEDVRKRAASTSSVGVHALGTIKASAGNAPGQFQEALLLRYSSMEDYAAAIKAGWWDELVKFHDLDKTMEDSAQLVVQPLELPAKGTKLDVFSWAYGDPYQRPGECWFG